MRGGRRPASGLKRSAGAQRQAGAGDLHLGEGGEETAGHGHGGEIVRVGYLGGASRVVDRAGDEDAAAAVDDEGAVVVRDGRIGRGGQERGRQEEDSEQDATTGAGAGAAAAAAGGKKTPRCGHGARRPPQRSSPPKRCSSLLEAGAVTCGFLAERSGNGKGVRWWRFSSRGGGNGDGRSQECVSFFFMLLLLLVVLSLFVRAAFGWFTAGGELLLRAWAVECVCACTGMVEWSGVGGCERRRERDGLLWMLPKSS